MLREEKIKKMIRLSDYEKGQGRLDLQRTKFMKMDYVRLQVLKTFVAVILAMALFLVLVVLYQAPYLLENAWTFPYEKWMIGMGIATFAIELISIVATCRIASKRYEESKHRVKEYYVTLRELLDMYKEEKQEDVAL